MVQERIFVQRENAPLQVTSDVKTQFRHIATWSFVLSGIGFILISFIIAGAILSAVSMGIIRSNHGLFPLFIGSGYLIVSALLFIPTFSLFRFGMQMKKALKEEDQSAMNGAFGSLQGGLRYGGLAVLGLLFFGGLGLFF